MPANDLDIYNREAENWWKTSPGLSNLRLMNAGRFRYFDGIVPDWTGKKTLDIGCGGGFASELMAKKGAVVYGMDLSARTIEMAKKHAAESGLRIDYRQGRAEQLPFEDGTFDIVLCVDVLEHVPDWPKAISEIYRVLKNGGTFLFDSINKTFISKIVMIWLCEYILKTIPKGLHDWNMFIKPEIMKATLAAAGFQEIDIRGFQYTGKDRASGDYRYAINDNTSSLYIGSCRKQAPSA